MNIDTKLTVDELKTELFKTIHSRLRKLKRTHHSERLRLYKEHWDKICSKGDLKGLRKKLIEQIIIVEGYNNKNFKLCFGKKRVYDLKSSKDRISRFESWKQTQNSRNLKREYRGVGRK